MPDDKGTMKLWAPKPHTQKQQTRDLLETNNVVDTFSTPIAQSGDEDGGCSVHHVVSLSRSKKLEPIGNHYLETTNESAEKVQNAKYYIRYNIKNNEKRVSG